MATRGGTADLPLHHGRVPRWLSEPMSKLARTVFDGPMRKKRPAEPEQLTLPGLKQKHRPGR